ncbi:MAG: malto-oligosyltrehalose synthase [Candidatus Dormibacteria bacterium]
MSVTGVTPPPPPRLATYRLQLRAEFGFREAAALLPYLRQLGVSHVYCSPYFQAAAGSTHGYDVVDPTRLSEELGGDEGWLVFRAALAEQGMSQVLDIVPNHMSTADPRNRWWWDVLADGRASPWSSFFDIDWETSVGEMRDRVLLPVLPDHLGRVMESGDISLVREGGALLVAHATSRFPLRVETVVGLVAEAVPAPAAALAAAVRALMPGVDDSSRRQRLEQRLDILSGVARVLEAPGAATAVDSVLAQVSGDLHRLDGILAEQHHRLARWQTGVEEVNYRRFFDITSLVAVRVDDPLVFREATATAVAMVGRGDVDGLRIDHIDGLSRPLRFADDLRAAAGARAWLLAEKILDGDEQPPPWALDGTSGYDFLAVVGGLFIDPSGHAQLTAFFDELRRDHEPFAATARACKREVLHSTLVSDVERLTTLLATVVAGSPVHRDHTRTELAAALVELVAALPVYRTYMDPARRPALRGDVDLIRLAAARVGEDVAGVDPRLIDTIASLLTDGVAGDVDTTDPAVRDASDELVLRFQQLCATATAKGVEDRAFYRHVALLCCNEVGASPAAPVTTLPGFHAHSQRVQDRRPLTLLATSTHDTKRSEDVRARLALLSEAPADWAAAVRRWRDMNMRHRAEWDDVVMEYTLYQTLVGAHPLSAERARAHMEKASREASLRTGWLRPDEEYDQHLAGFVQAVCADRSFCDDVAAFVASLAPHDRINSLSMTLLRLTSPGVPDTYRGTELWDRSLVDPDNRREVDWERRRELMVRHAGRRLADVWGDDDADGAAKLVLIRDALGLRRRRPEAFGAGGRYLAMQAGGAFADDVVAFTRGEGGDVLTVAVRGSLRRRGSWGDTRLMLPAGRWCNLFDSATWEREVALAQLLERAPVALLERGP